MIQWYPGHMAKSMRSIEDNVKRVDLIVYVLDARAPESTRNPQFDRLAGKPVVYALNKTDLADPAATAKFVRRLSGGGAGVRAVALNATASGASAALAAEARALCADKLEKCRAKGVRATIRAMVIGVPNCGKSTLINNLAGKAKTVTGDRAGVTRGTQWVRVNDYFEVLDTPGTLYPKFTDERAAYNLAFIGSIRDEVLDTAELAQRLIETLNGISPGLLAARYGAAVASSEDVARARGFLLKGGLPDGERAAAAVIDDFRKGRLGRITLDEPDAERRA